jgi:hypothetical protein
MLSSAPSEGRKRVQRVARDKEERTEGKRINLQTEFVFSTKEVLKTLREAEVKSTEKRPRGRPCKRPIEEEQEQVEEEKVRNNSSYLELELEECVARRTRSTRQE